MIKPHGSDELNPLYVEDAAEREKLLKEAVRELHDASGMPFIEVYLDVPLNVAEERDPKGLYKKARAGEIKNFTGIDDPYEAPENAEIVLKSHEMSLEEEVEVLLRELENRGIIPAA